MPQEDKGETERAFRNLIRYCEPVQRKEPYKTVTLIRETYERVQAKELFLCDFFTFLSVVGAKIPDGPPGVSQYATYSRALSISQQKEIEDCVSLFGEYLFERFFLPVVVSSRLKAQSALSGPSASTDRITDTATRESPLRRDCLIRDHHRCVISRAFDVTEAVNRKKKYGCNAKDDDSEQLDFMSGYMAVLEVVHILPRSLLIPIFPRDLTTLRNKKPVALGILYMFDPSVTPLFTANASDYPANAICLVHGMHKLFTEFKLYFEEMDPKNHPKHTFRIISTNTDLPNHAEESAITRTLLHSPNDDIDLPSLKLLAIHRAISIILHKSDANKFIDRIISLIEKGLWGRELL